MGITAIILLLICLANLLLGLFVFLRNPNARTGQSFLGMTVIIDIYAVANYLTDNASSLAGSILFNRVSYLSAFWALAATVVFTRFFVGRKRRILSIGEVITVMIVSFFAISHYVTGDVNGQKDNYVFTTGSAAILYDIILIVLLGLIVRDLISFYKRGDTNQKNQTRIIAGGFSASIIIAMLTNAIIPALSSNYQSTKLGPPLLSLVLISSITYAIVRHQLFDIRPIVARSFAYVLTLFSIAAVYSVIVFGIANDFFKTRAAFNQELLYVTFTIIAALSFQPLSQLFNRFANRLFLRDFYEPQEVLDRLSNVLVGSGEVKDVEGESSRILKGALHPSFIKFLLTSREEEYAPLLRLLHATREEMVVSDDLYEAHHGSLYQAMKDQDAALAVKLRTRHEMLGYLLLGYKNSGSPYSNGDKRLLNIAADEIAISLQNALRFEEIRRFNETLQQKVDEATQQLRHANKRLKELDATKDEFISIASHQLRTPLTTIKGYLSMVLEGDVGPVTKNERQMIQQAFDSAERMVFLIADLLNVSRLQSGKFVIENNPTDLAKMVQAEVAQLQEVAKNHHLSLVFKSPAKLPLLNLDDTKIRQVVMNFIDNAIYYTPAGGSIEVALEATDKELRFTVTDTGLGVPKEAQHHLFSKFYRAGNARKMRPDGTGLGLFMAKKVITAQGGAIIFNSVEGKGSTFGFSFPRGGVELKSAPSEKPKEAVLAA